MFTYAQQLVQDVAICIKHRKSLAAFSSRLPPTIIYACLSCIQSLRFQCFLPLFVHLLVGTVRSN
jgi:hypothetical protein